MSIPRDFGVFRSFNNGTSVGAVLYDAPSSGVLWNNGDVELTPSSFSFGLYHPFFIEKYQIDISNQSARKITKEDFEIFDVIYAMDLNNYNDIIKMTNNPIHKEKVKVILNEIYPEMNHPVPDPYYGGENGFQDVYNLLDKACNKIIEKIEKR